MQYKTPLNKFMPELQEVLREFARKSHAVNLIVIGLRPNVRDRGVDPGDPVVDDEYQLAAFVDPRFTDRADKTERVGSVEICQAGTPEQVFVIRSRLIENEKYRRGSYDYSSKSSSNKTKVVKTMVDTIVPFRYTEIFDFQHSRTRDLVGSWRGELYNTGSAGWTVYAPDVFEEVKHLRNLGVQFKTEKFRNLAKYVEDFAEHQTRISQPVEIFHVFVNGPRVAVTSKTMGIHGTYNEAKATVMYDSLEALPEGLLADVSMLKILGGDAKQFLPGIGYRVSDDEFFVMKPLANDSNA